MSHTSALFLSLIAAGMMNAQEPSKPRLTARELFYKPVKAAPESTTPKAGPKGPKRSKQTTPEAVTGEVKTPNPPPRVTLPGGGSIVQAAAGPALGLRYSIVKTVNKHVVGEVPADSVFQTGDGLQLKVETNTAGYLYVVNQGSSGTWKPMFPSPEISGGNNRVEGFRTIFLPSKEHQMTFDQHPGVENLFLVFSREPVQDFEDLIYSLQDKTKPAAQPPTQPSGPAKDKVVMAMAKIEDAMVGRFRQTYSRDLVIEQVTPDMVDSSARKETAVYVVNPTGSADSRLVADLKLRHQ